MLFKLFITGVGIFEIISKGLRSIDVVIYFLVFVFAIWTGYRLMVYLLYIYMKTILTQKSLDIFFKILGDKYFFKKLGHGEKRYRWAKWYIVVKANFDEEGNQISTKVEPFLFWHYGSVLSFI